MRKKPMQPDGIEKTQFTALVWDLLWLLRSAGVEITPGVENRMYDAARRFPMPEGGRKLYGTAKAAVERKANQ